MKRASGSGTLGNSNSTNDRKTIYTFPEQANQADNNPLTEYYGADGGEKNTLERDMGKFLFTKIYLNFTFY